MPVALRLNLTGDWKKTARELGTARKRLTGAIDTAVRQEAEDARKKIIEGIRQQAPGGESFLPISRLTRALRRAQGFRGSKALIRTAGLMNSVSVKRAGRGRYFVGVLRSARGKDNTELINVALVHEEGRTFVIRVTPKMKRFLMATLRRAGMLAGRRRGASSGGIEKGYIVVHIRARPFVGPVLRRIRSNPQALRTRIGARVAEQLGYTLGR